MIPLILSVVVKSASEDGQGGWECGMRGRPTRETTHVHIYAKIRGFHTQLDEGPETP